MTRREARAAGLRKYEAHPCRHCACTARYVSSGFCVLCASKRAAAWHRAQDRRAHLERLAAGVGRWRAPEHIREAYILLRRKVGAAEARRLVADRG